MNKTGFTRFFLLAGMLVLFLFSPGAGIAHESHSHDHGHLCQDCNTNGTHGHQHDHDDDHLHNNNHSHAADSSSSAQPQSGTHEHVHHHGHTCPVCGGDHDEGHHQKELERVKFETITVKYRVLKQRAIAMSAIAGLLILISIFRFKKSKG